MEAKENVTKSLNISSKFLCPISSWASSTCIQTCTYLPEAIARISNTVCPRYFFSVLYLHFSNQNTTPTQETSFLASSSFSLRLCPLSPASLLNPNCFDLCDQLEFLSSAPTTLSPVPAPDSATSLTSWVFLSHYCKTLALHNSCQSILQWPPFYNY